MKGNPEDEEEEVEVTEAGGDGEAEGEEIEQREVHLDGSSGTRGNSCRKS